MPIRIIADDRLPAFTTNAETRQHPVPLAWHLMLDAGLRVGEVVSLAWCDLVWENQPKDALAIPAYAAKGGRARTIPIAAPLRQAIHSAWTLHAKPAGFAPAHYAAAKKPNRKPVTVRTLERAVTSIGKALGTASLTPHMLRHTFATRLLRVTNLRTVQMALGHKRITTTEIYTHPNQDDLRKALALLD